MSQSRTATDIVGRHRFWYTSPQCWEEFSSTQGDPMPRRPLHALIWSPDQHQYELYTQDQLEQHFRPEDEAAWQSWLGEVTSFAFQGAAGNLNVYGEAWPRGRPYWYADHTT